MPGTWLDYLRGIAQGRVQPAAVAPPDGSNVFALGGDAIPERSLLKAGDYTEIRQLVDLTSYDLVSATMDTVGKTAGQIPVTIGWPAHANDLFHFNFDFAGPNIPNLIEGGFSLVGSGPITEGTETYSPDQTVCRAIPVNSSNGKLLGTNTPQFKIGTMATYTLQMWINFDALAHVTSQGISPLVFVAADAVPPLNGIIVQLAGASGVGAHQWTFVVTHMDGNLVSSVPIPGYVIDTPNPGWRLYSLVFNWWNPVGQKLGLYVDNNPTPYYAAVDPTQQVGTVSAGQPIQVADGLLWGEFDELRMLDVAFDTTAIATSYQQSTVAQPPIDLQWAMSILVDDIVYGQRVIDPAEARRWTDFRVPVRHLKGDHDVAFRLELQEAT